jgi:hypothetical protein
MVSKTQILHGKIPNLSLFQTTNHVVQFANSGIHNYKLYTIYKPTSNFCCPQTQN